MAVDQLASMLNVPTSSRAGSLPPFLAVRDNLLGFLQASNTVALWAIPYALAPLRHQPAVS